MEYFDYFEQKLLKIWECEQKCRNRSVSKNMELVCTLKMACRFAHVKLMKKKNMKILEVVVQLVECKDFGGDIDEKL